MWMNWMDKGAEVSAITEETYQKLHVKLAEPLKTLYGPSQAILTGRSISGKAQPPG